MLKVREMDVFVDGELESLLGMFNFDQCSSSKEEKPQDEMLSLSSLYNGHLRHHHQNNVLCLLTNMLS